MHDVKTLIKMQKLYVDEQRRVLAQKLATVDALEAAVNELEEGLEAEKKNEQNNKEGGFLFGAFLKKELNRRDEIERMLSTARREVDVEREKLSGLFEELKRFELVQENWEEEARRESQRKENLGYDEQASTRHQRKEKED